MSQCITSAYSSVLLHRQVMVTGMLYIINKVKVFAKFTCYSFSKFLFCRDVSVSLYSVGQDYLKWCLKVVARLQLEFKKP